MAKNKHRGVCPYCGREKNLTREHVIPDTFFQEADPDMAVVYICYQCNNGMSAPVRDLRNFVAMHIGSSNHPDSEFHAKKIVDTNEATRDWLRRVLEDAREVDFISEQGVVLGSGLLTEFNRERARRALANVVRGLYLIETDSVLPLDVDVSAIDVDPRIAQATVQTLIRFEHRTPKQKGNRVAAWVPFLNVEGEGPESTLWIITLLDDVCFLGGTGAVAAFLEDYWRKISENRDQLEEVDGRLQMRVPRLPDGTYWIPPL